MSESLPPERLLRMAMAALNTAPRFKVPSMPPLYDDSYKIAAVLDRAIATKGALIKTRHIEALADICFLAGASRYHTGDSREDIDSFIAWANEFESLRVELPNGDEQYLGEEYMDAIQTFVQMKTGVDPASI